MSFDGEYVTEGEFDSINDAWQRANDMGSRWFFYPFHFVVTESCKTVASSPDGLEHFNRQRLATVRNAFEYAAALPETQGVDCDVFSLYLR
jgi:hypothetical protein